LFSILNFTGHMYPSVELESGLGFWPNINPLFIVWLAFWQAELLFSLVVLVRSLRTLDGHQRDQVKYMAASFVIGYLGGNTNWFMWFKIHVPPYLNFLVSVYTIVLAYTIVKHRLFDVTIIVRRTLIYSIVMATLTAFYMILIVLITHYSEKVMSHPQLWGALFAATVTTLIFHPLRSRVQHFIDNKFYRVQADRETKLMELSTEIIQQGNTERLTHFLCRTLEDSLHPKVLGLYLETQGSGEFLEMSGKIPASWAKVLPAKNSWVDYFGRNPQPILRDSLERVREAGSGVLAAMEPLGVCAAVPLVSRNDVLGFLLLGEKRSEERYTNEDLMLMRIIVNQATVAYERPKLLREVSGGFVHEVKTPLSRISLPAELTLLEVEQMMKDGGKVEDLLPKIQRRMKYIIDQAFLAGHRVDALQQLGSTENQQHMAVRLSEVVCNTLLTLDESLKQAGVTVRNTLPEELPAVMGDSKQLEIVFVNLFRNAIEAMGNLAAGRPREIIVEAEAQEDKVIIHVKDSGPGIAAENIDKIFQSRYTTKGSNGGSTSLTAHAGMGLFLCRQIVEAHGGSIESLSCGAGAEFVLCLPL
jgi:signal transduction histidine kinase